MKVFKRTIRLRTSKPFELINITGDVERVVKESRVKNGTVIVFSPHTTLGVFINEDEERLKEDVVSFLEKLAPRGAGYRHDEIDNNAHSHLRTILMGSSVLIPVSDGRLVTGTWQSIFVAEFDGPRARNYIIQVMGE